MLAPTDSGNRDGCEASGASAGRTDNSQGEGRGCLEQVENRTATEGIYSVFSYVLFCSFLVAMRHRYLSACPERVGIA